MLLVGASCNQPKSPTSEEKMTNELPDSVYKEYLHELETLYVLDYSQKLQMVKDEPSTLFSESMIKSIQFDAKMFEMPSSKKKYGNKVYNEQILQDSLAYVKAYAIKPNNLGGDPFHNRITNGVFIPIAEYHQLVAVLKNPKSYDTSVSACFYPKIGLVMYDRTNAPLGSISICLDCNQFHASIKTGQPNTALQGLSTKARMQLRQLFFKWNFDYYGFREGYDDLEEYEEYLTQKNEEIETVSKSTSTD